MNKVIETLFERKSVRQFTPQEISQEEKQLILESALQAPTAGNQVLYTILDIDDQSIKDKLAVLCDNQPFIAESKMVLVFLADCRKWWNAYRYAKAEMRNPGPGDFLLACCDALIAAENAVIAAQSLGIGSCYIGDILENCEEVTSLLTLKDYVVPVTLVVFGYPTREQMERKKPKRFDLDFVVQKNNFHELTEQQTREMFTKLANKDDFDYDTYLKSICKRKYVSDFSVEMNRSVEKYLRAFFSDR
ncbi:MAG: nitroreductase family protein [Spirochaetes bacterium]|nr:nitroreductase family protein [Spirochaetota bacterium]NLJ04222.1 nitroreductase [Exilispira sp.]MBP8991972.1 nitroreductase family protein [Spirochaetota bacterium]HOV46677.1 nitroreductase family protein [Exilispira sp.]HQM89811.1 nitroreductase family protein [Exilispira sp.]